MKGLGENIYAEFQAAGLTMLLDRPIIMLYDEAATKQLLTLDQRVTFDAVVAAHVPRDLTAQERYERNVGRLDETILRAIFNHENRLRALEGKPAINRNQFLNGLKALIS